MGGGAKGSWIDTERGELHLGDGLWIRSGMSEEQLLQRGVVFGRVADMRNGWTHKGVDSPRAPIEDLHHSLTVFRGQLGQVHCSVSLPGVDIWTQPEIYQQAHRRLLEEELGPPHETQVHGVSYRYAWGAVTAMIDMKGGTSGITVTWPEMAEMRERSLRR